MSASSARLTQGSVERHLVALTVPLIWGILAMMSFNLVDTWFVSLLGAEALAAMSFTFPVVMLLVSLGLGLMVGTSSVLARAVGEGEAALVRRIATDALILAAAISLAITALGLATMDTLFTLLGAPPALLPLIGEYMSVWYAGYFCFLMPMVVMGAIRATGDARLQRNLMMLGAALNLVLDPLLIFGLLGFPRLGIQGAALATVIARAVTIAVGYWLVKRMGLLSFELPSWGTLLRSWRKVLHVGLPAAGTNAIIPVSTGVVVALLAGFGPEAVAGFGAATRIENVALVVFYAMSSAIGPFVGQNLGAGEHERIAAAVRACVRYCVLIGIGLAVALAIGATPLIGLFSDAPAVVAVGASYLLIVPVSYAAAGIVMVVNASFNGLGQPLPAVAISSLRVIVLYLPAAWLGATLLGAAGIFAAACLCNLLCGAIAYGWHRRVCGSTGR